MNHDRARQRPERRRSFVRAGAVATRRRVAVLVTAVLLAGLLWMVQLTPSPVSAAAGKITICHRTHSTTNPYRRITVSQNAVQNARHGGHDLPNGSLNPAVYDPTFIYASNNKYWGDIIPGSDAALAYNGTDAIALNWTTAGKADFAAYCAAMTPTEFYSAEITAGQTQADVIADLNDQAANEDTALLAALGGSFTTLNMSTWTTAVTVTTNAATQVTSATATLNGSLTVGTTSTVPKFQYGTSPTLATSTTIAATPSPVTGTTSATAAVTGLTPSTTYYYMVTGTTNAGTDAEGILLGTILSFTTSADGSTTTTTSSTTTSSTTSTTTTTVSATTTSTTTTVPATTTSTTTTVPATTTSTTTTVPATTTSTTTTVPATTSTSTTSTTTPQSTTTSTTVAPAPTTTAPTVDGSVQGVVWFDRNGNGVFDSNEWVLPGVTVTLDAGSNPQIQTLRTQAATNLRTAFTAADGSYFFGGLPTGSYQVTATVTIKGFDYTSDTDGATDWKVSVHVAALATSTADFAGLGRGEVTGQVFDSITLQGVAGAAIQCRWSGYDDVLGNADDVMFSLTADATGSFDMAGVPYGYFTCDGRDPLIDRQSSPVGATVFSPEAVNAPLPVGSAAPAGTLPTTGRDTLTTVLLSLLFVGLGAATLLASRRRKLQIGDTTT